MSAADAALRAELRARPRAWLVTGAAGFIGSHLVERLLELGQRVRGLDDFSTGRPENLPLGREGFEFVRGDVRDARAVERALAGVELVLHQAALGSVPRSLADPERTLAVNAQGTWTVLAAARAAGCARVVYASSSSVYGDSQRLPHAEDELGRPLSPYAASKRCAELAALGVTRGLGLATVGLRYFNVFGPRQAPEGEYAAVIPRWCAALAAGRAPLIHGDGSTTRDFTPVETVVRANLLAALGGPGTAGAVLNVGTGVETRLDALFAALQRAFAAAGRERSGVRARHVEARPHDRTRSRANTARARAELGLEPGDLESGLTRTVASYLAAER